MPTDAGSAAAGWNFDNSYARLPGILYAKVRPVPVRAPAIVLFNEPLAEVLGLRLAAADDRQSAQLLAGNLLPDGADSLAQAYAGHQFGHFTMLGDGRAVLLGEQITPDGSRRDLQLKGSGRTPYSRQGDGRAALGPMLREYLISEAMQALGIPTTRSLAVVTTGETVIRDRVLQGAVLSRVAASHVRVGTFEFVAANGDINVLRQLADWTIARHYPEVAHAAQPYKALLAAVIERLAGLVAAWMHVGFVHGVLNTDNIALSGETLDYGPCAFMDTFDPATVFSSIDRHGRYAYGRQPTVMQWNMARFAETLLPLLHDDPSTAISLAEEAVRSFSEAYQRHWLVGLRRKLGWLGEEAGDAGLIVELQEWMQQHQMDYTLCLRALSTGRLAQDARFQTEVFQAWHRRCRERQQAMGQSAEGASQTMLASNPALIPRNHQVESALLAATEQGDFGPFNRLLHALGRPWEDNTDWADLMQPPPAGGAGYRTYCGT